MPQPPYRRRHPRFPYTAEVWIGQDGIYERAGTHVTDLSFGGARIQASGWLDSRYDVGDLVDLQFRLIPGRPPIRCTAIVRNTTPGRSLGVEFMDLDDDDAARLRAFAREASASS
jgi:hypothetical protein